MRHSIWRIGGAVVLFVAAIFALYCSVFWGWASVAADGRSEIARLELASDLALGCGAIAGGVAVFLAFGPTRDERKPAPPSSTGPAEAG